MTLFSWYTQNVTLDLVEFISWKLGLHHNPCLSPSVADGRVLTVTRRANTECLPSVSWSSEPPCDCDLVET